MQDLIITIVFLIQKNDTHNYKPTFAHPYIQCTFYITISIFKF